jgi:hypothetical protein
MMTENRRHGLAMLTIEPQVMTRREALNRTVAAVGGALLTAPAVAIATAATAASATTADTAAKDDPKHLPREAPRFDDPVWNREQSARLEAHTDGRQVYGRATGCASVIRNTWTHRPGGTVRVYPASSTTRWSSNPPPPSDAGYRTAAI